MVLIIRGAEARAFLDALNTGLRGSLSTIHANGAEDALRRLGHLAMRASGGMTLKDAESESRSSIDVVLHVSKVDGVRQVQEVSASSSFIRAQIRQSFPRTKVD